MKIDIRPVIKNYEGKNMKTIDEQGKETGLLTVKLALNRVINGVELVETPRGRQQKILTAEERGRIYQLSTKLWNARKRVEFTHDEVTFLRDRAGKVSDLTPLLYGRVCDLLEGKNEEKSEEKPKEEYAAKESPEASSKKG